jgi:hypothetical protein
MSNQYGIKEVLNLSFYDYATNNPLLYVDYAETTEIDNTGTRIDISGGQGNYRLLSFDHSKISTLKLKLPLVDTTLMAMLMGDTVATGAQNVFQREVVTVSAGTATLSQTPLTGTTPSVFYLNGARDNGTSLTKVASAPTAGQYSISGTTITVNTGDNGKQLVVWYQYATPTTTTKFSMKANKFATPMKVVGDGIVRDQVTGTDKAAKITIYNAKFKPNFNWAMSSTAATSLDMELDMYAVPQGSDLVYYDVVFLT